jgi:hypothetical protein
MTRLRSYTGFCKPEFVAAWRRAHGTDFVWSEAALQTVNIKAMTEPMRLYLADPSLQPYSELVTLIA